MMPGLLALGKTGGEEGVGTHPGCPLTPLHSGSQFKGHQQSKGNKYQVEVVFKVSSDSWKIVVIFFMMLMDVNKVC